MKTTNLYWPPKCGWCGLKQKTYPQFISHSGQLADWLRQIGIDRVIHQRDQKKQFSVRRTLLKLDAAGAGQLLCTDDAHPQYERSFFSLLDDVVDVSAGTNHRAAHF
jgi:hypothetical protein